MVRAALPWIVAALSACRPARFAAVGPKSTDVSTKIERVELMWSNVYLLRNGDAYGLVDTGSPVDRDRLYDALVRAGVHPRDVRVVVLTHGHADHARLRSRNARGTTSSPPTSVTARNPPSRASVVVTPSADISAPEPSTRRRRR